MSRLEENNLLTVGAQSLSDDTKIRVINNGQSRSTNISDLRTALGASALGVQHILPFALIASDAGVLNLDVNIANSFDILLTENVTLINLPPSATLPEEHHTLTLRFAQEGTGGFIVDWPASTLWPGGLVPVITPALGSVDVITLFTTDMGVTWYGLANANFLSAPLGPTCDLTGIWTEQAAIVSGGSSTGDAGVTVGSDGDYFVVGAPFEQDQAPFTHGGAQIHFFDGATWALQQQIYQGGGAVPGSNTFGAAVSISGTTVAIASPTPEEIEIYDRVGTVWSLTQVIATPAVDFLQPADYISLSGDYLAVGVASEDVGGDTDAGRVFIYFRSGGTFALQQTLVSANQSASGRYGESVSLNLTGDMLAVGHPGAPSLGAVEVLTRTGSVWSLAQTVVASGLFGGELGVSVSLRGDYLVAGAAPLQVAAVFFNTAGTWAEQQQLAPTGNIGGDMGFSVEMNSNGSQLYAGSPANDSGTGAVHVFDRVGTTWTQSAILLASDGANGDDFGSSVAHSDNAAPNCPTLVVGAPDNISTYTFKD